MSVKTRSVTALFPRSFFNGHGAFHVVFAGASSNGQPVVASGGVVVALAAVAFSLPIVGEGLLVP